MINIEADQSKAEVSYSSILTNQCRQLNLVQPLNRDAIDVWSVAAKYADSCLLNSGIHKLEGSNII